MFFDCIGFFGALYWKWYKKLDCSSAEFMTIDEGLYVQIMHLGPFDEIYMSDARKVAPEKWKTVIRHPIRKA